MFAKNTKRACDFSRAKARDKIKRNFTATKSLQYDLTSKAKLHQKLYHNYEVSVSL